MKIHYLKPLFLSGVLFLGACAGGPQAPWDQFATQKHPWGYYSGPVDTRWSSDGRTMTLLNELRYTDPKGTVWIAPSGSEIDGASIPRALWSFMGGPFEGRYRNASVLHDVAYDQKNHPPQEADRMFYNAMRCSGVGPIEAKTMYYALLRFGRHWKFQVKRAKRVDTGEETARPSAVEPANVDTIQQWIRENDPSLNQIEQRAGSGPQ
jgi:hypothetical protein